MKLQKSQSLIFVVDLKFEVPLFLFFINRIIFTNKITNVRWVCDFLSLFSYLFRLQACSSMILKGQIIFQFIQKVLKYHFSAGSFSSFVVTCNVRKVIGDEGCSSILFWISNERWMIFVRKCSYFIFHHHHEIWKYSLGKLHLFSL